MRCLLVRGKEGAADGTREKRGSKRRHRTRLRRWAGHARGHHCGEEGDAGPARDRPPSYQRKAIGQYTSLGKGTPCANAQVLMPHPVNRGFSRHDERSKNTKCQSALTFVGPCLPDKDESCVQSGKTRLLGS